MEYFKLLLNAQSETEMRDFINSFGEKILAQGDKITICFFCYIFDISCKKARL